VKPDNGLPPLLPPCRFDLNGVTIAIESNTDSVVSMMRTRPYGRELAESASPDIAFRIFERQPLAAPAKRGFFQNDEIQFIAHDKYSVVFYSRCRPWRVDITSFDYETEDLFFCVFDPLLFTCLMRLGQILWHASAVTSRGRSIIIPADAKGGKSTTALTLVSAGFDFLADDNIFLLLQGTQVSAASFDNELFLRKPSVDRLSELDMVQTAEWTIRGEEEKKRVDMRSARDPRAVPWPVAMVLFPSIENREDTVLQPLSRAEGIMACLELGLAAKNPIAIFRDRLASEAQLKIYTALATTSNCYRILLGSDPKHVAEQVWKEFDRCLAVT
jgi:hypothetical protein